MNFDVKRKMLQQATPQGFDRTEYQVSPSDKSLVAFTARIHGSRSTRTNAEGQIAQCCELNRRKLLIDGGTIDVDLNEVSIA